MSGFNLGERDLTINVKNYTLEKPENTVFKATDYKGENYYRGTYHIPDIKKLNGNSIKMNFNTLHCKYDLTIAVNPNNYQKNIDITYKYNNAFQCVIDVLPESFKKNVEIKTSTITPTYDISLNDLQVWHYMAGFIFGLFLVIAVGIRYIDKKGLLIQNRNK